MISIEIEKAEGEDLTPFLRDPDIEQITWKRWSNVYSCLIETIVSRITDDPAVMPFMSPQTYQQEFRKCHWWDLTITVDGDHQSSSTMAIPFDDTVYSLREAVKARMTP